MFGLQPTHWLIIIIVALLFFMPSRLPELGRALGKTIQEFKATAKELKKGAEEPSDPSKKTPS